MLTFAYMQYVLYNYVFFKLALICRQVFLARRRDKDKQFYAIKVVKKTDVVNKNVIEQGITWF